MKPKVNNTADLLGDYGFIPQIVETKSKFQLEKHRRLVHDCRFQFLEWIPLAKKLKIRVPVKTIPLKSI